MRIHYLYQKATLLSQETIALVPLQYETHHDQKKHNRKPKLHPPQYYLPLLVAQRHL